MQIKLFTVSIADNNTAAEELNSFLRSHRVIECIQELVSNENGANWCFCVKYIDTPEKTPDSSLKRKDYKNELDEKTFSVFSILRTIRKGIAAEEAIPAYAVATDEELAEIAKLNEINITSLQQIKGFGQKKIEKFGARIIEKWQEIKANEASKQSL